MWECSKLMQNMRYPLFPANSLKQDWVQSLQLLIDNPVYSRYIYNNHMIKSEHL